MDEIDNVLTQLYEEEIEEAGDPPTDREIEEAWERVKLRMKEFVRLRVSAMITRH